MGQCVILQQQPHCLPPTAFTAYAYIANTMSYCRYFAAKVFKGGDVRIDNNESAAGLSQWVFVNAVLQGTVIIFDISHSRAGQAGKDLRLRGNPGGIILLELKLGFNSQIVKAQRVTDWLLEENRRWNRTMESYCSCQLEWSWWIQLNITNK